MSAVPLRVLEFSSHESNSVQSLQFSNRLFSRRLCIFHFPTKKSKSFGDDVDDAVIFRSPFVSKLNFGIGRLGSVVRTVCCACAWSMPVPLAPMLQIATARIVIKYFISQFSDVIVRSSTVEQWQCGSHLTYSTAERSAFQFRLPLNTLRDVGEAFTFSTSHPLNGLNVSAGYFFSAETIWLLSVLVLPENGDKRVTFR